MGAERVAARVLGLAGIGGGAATKRPRLPGPQREVFRRRRQAVDGARSSRTPRTLLGSARRTVAAVAAPCCHPGVAASDEGGTRTRAASDLNAEASPRDGCPRGPPAPTPRRYMRRVRRLRRGRRRARCGSGSTRAESVHAALPGRRSLRRTSPQPLCRRGFPTITTTKAVCKPERQAQTGPRAVVSVLRNVRSSARTARRTQVCASLER